MSAKTTSVEPLARKAPDAAHIAKGFALHEIVEANSEMSGQTLDPVGEKGAKLLGRLGDRDNDLFETELDELLDIALD